MKVFFALSILFVCRLGLFAQSDQLPLDENGKFTYFELVNQPQMNEFALKTQFLIFLQKYRPKLKVNSTQADSVIECTGKFVIQKTILVSAHPSGEIQYKLQIEFKRGKYRFWLSNFEYLPYQRDRYGNFVPSTNRGVMLEKSPDSLNKGAWYEIRSLAAKFSADFALSLKANLSPADPENTPKTVKSVQKVW